MKISGIAWLVVVALVVLVAAPAVAQTPPAGASTTNMEILAQKLKADKKLLVAATVE